MTPKSATDILERMKRNPYAKAVTRIKPKIINGKKHKTKKQRLRDMQREMDAK